MVVYQIRIVKRVRLDNKPAQPAIMGQQMMPPGCAQYPLTGRLGKGAFAIRRGRFQRVQHCAVDAKLSVIMRLHPALSIETPINRAAVAVFLRVARPFALRTAIGCERAPYFSVSPQQPFAVGGKLLRRQKVVYRLTFACRAASRRYGRYQYVRYQFQSGREAVIKRLQRCFLPCEDVPRPHGIMVFARSMMQQQSLVAAAPCAQAILFMCRKKRVGRKWAGDAPPEATGVRGATARYTAARTRPTLPETGTGLARIYFWGNGGWT